MIGLESPFYDRLVVICYFCGHPREWRTSWHGCSRCACRKTVKDAKAIGVGEETITLREAIMRADKK